MILIHYNIFNMNFVENLKDIFRYIMTIIATASTNDGSSFEEWSQWTPCSIKSGDGIRKRFRMCLKGFQCPKQLEDVEKCTSAAEIVIRPSMISFVNLFL